RRAIAPPPSPSWPISHWRPASASTGTPRPNASSTARRPTSSCTTSIASPGRSPEPRWFPGEASAVDGGVADGALDAGGGQALVGVGAPPGEPRPLSGLAD